MTELPPATRKAFDAYSLAVFQQLNPGHEPGHAIGEDGIAALAGNPAMLAMLEAHRAALWSEWMGHNTPNSDDWQGFVRDRIGEQRDRVIKFGPDNYLCVTWVAKTGEGVMWRFLVPHNGKTAEVSNSVGFKFPPAHGFPYPPLSEQINMCLSVLEGCGIIEGPKP